jgi:ketosteroid isomerase-like protein
MTMALQAGDLDALDEFIDPDCMAAFMEQEMPKPVDPRDPGKKGRRDFLIALSRGIINYLKAHDTDSFAVHVTSGNQTLNGQLEID